MALNIERNSNYVKVKYFSSDGYKEWYLKGPAFHLKHVEGELRLMNVNLLEIPEGSFLEIKDGGLVRITDRKTIEEMANELTS